MHIHIFICMYTHIYLDLKYFLNQVLFPDISCSGNLFDSGDDRVPSSPPFSSVSEQNLPDSKPNYGGINYIICKPQIHHCFWIYLQIIFDLLNRFFAC